MLVLGTLIKKVATATEPWVTFTAQNELWTEENLLELATEWPNFAAAKISIGDATIKDIANYYMKSGYSVEILTG